MKYTLIPLDTFQQMALNAGILVNKFDIENIPTKEELYEALIGATSGGINVKATANYTDMGEDIDNCPKNTKELKELESWDTSMSGTFVTMSKDSTKFMLGAADISEDKTKITLRNDLDPDSDFQDLWWLCDYNQGKGVLMAHMKNALSTGGLSIQSTDKEKAKADFEFTGHYSINAQDDVPMDFAIIEDESVLATSVKQTSETAAAVANLNATADDKDSEATATSTKTTKKK